MPLGDRHFFDEIHFDFSDRLELVNISFEDLLKAGLRLIGEDNSLRRVAVYEGVECRYMEALGSGGAVRFGAVSTGRMRASGGKRT
jgi:hypothetical protein